MRALSEGQPFEATACEVWYEQPTEGNSNSQNSFAVALHSGTAAPFSIIVLRRLMITSWDTLTQAIHHFLLCQMGEQ
jgi:hypothetical protein